MVADIPAIRHYQGLFLTVYATIQFMPLGQVERVTERVQHVQKMLQHDGAREGNMQWRMRKCSAGIDKA